MSSTKAEHDYYKRIKLLGEGSFGKAYLVKSLNDDSLCVVKQIDLTQMGENEKQETLNEAKILESLNHHNIIRFREVYKTKKGRLCIVMDYADGGDLAARIKDQKGEHFSEDQILDWFTQICLGLKHIHEKRILYRDLKSQNIFLTKDNIIKLGDFGIAKVLNNTQAHAITMIGTPYYLSPEIINGKPYNLKSDIWALGVLLYEMCMLKHPFDAKGLPFLMRKISKGTYAPVSGLYSRGMRELVDSMLRVNPKERPSIGNLLHLPIIQERIKKFLNETIKSTEFANAAVMNQPTAANKKKDSEKQAQQAQQAHKTENHDPAVDALLAPPQSVLERAPISSPGAALRPLIHHKKPSPGLYPQSLADRNSPLTNLRNLQPSSGNKMDARKFFPGLLAPPATIPENNNIIVAHVQHPIIPLGENRMKLNQNSPNLSSGQNFMKNHSAVGSLSALDKLYDEEHIKVNRSPKVLLPSLDRFSHQPGGAQPKRISLNKLTESPVLPKLERRAHHNVPDNKKINVKRGILQGFDKPHLHVPSTRDNTTADQKSSDESLNKENSNNSHSSDDKRRSGVIGGHPRVRMPFDDEPHESKNKFHVNPQKLQFNDEDDILSNKESNAVSDDQIKINIESYDDLDGHPTRISPQGRERKPSIESYSKAFGDEKNKAAKRMGKEKEDEIKDLEGMIQEMNNIISKVEHDVQSCNNTPLYRMSGTLGMEFPDKEEHHRADDREDDPEDHHTLESNINVNGNGISDGEKSPLDKGDLNQLKKKLEASLGHNNFLRTYKVVKELVDKHEDPYKIEEDMDLAVAILPFLSKDEIKNNFLDMITFVVMERWLCERGY